MTVPKSAEVIHLVNFDPNQIDSLQAIRLGIPEKQTRALLHYRAKGGYFNTSNDFSKLYGLKNELYLLLSPYIKIAPRIIAYSRGNLNRTAFKMDRVEEPIWKIEMNTAGETEWLSKTKLPNDIVHRILSYRNYIGTFSNPHQLSKVYGITDSVLQKLKGHVYIQAGTKVILNANAMSFKDWKQLGLFSDQQVWAILRLKKENDGKIGWARLVEVCDLSQNEAMQLRQQIHFIE